MYCILEIALCRNKWVLFFEQNVFYQIFPKNSVTTPLNLSFFGHWLKRKTLFLKEISSLLEWKYSQSL